MCVEAGVVRRLLNWFNTHGREYPWRKSRDPYEVLIAEMMLQRTKSDQVARLYRRFLEQYPDPHSLARAAVEDVETLLLPLGLKWRGRKMWELGGEVVKLFNGVVPDEKEKLLTLPGVGEYAANAVLCFAYRRDVPVIDANVCRVIGRLFNLRPKGEARRDRRFIEKAYSLHKCVPSGRSGEYNWALLDFAAGVCRPGKPLCTMCPLNDLCLYPEKKSVP